MANESTLYKLKTPAGAEKVSEYPTLDKEMAKQLDEVLNEVQDIVQAGVVGSTSWSFTASIAEATAELGFAGEIAESIAWLPNPTYTGGRLLRTITPKEKPAGEIAPTKPNEGKYVAIAYELSPSTHNAACTLKLHAGTEEATEKSALEHAPSTSITRIQVRRVVIENVGGKYKIASQEDVRPYAFPIASTGPTYGKQETRTSNTEYEASATRATFVEVLALRSGAGTEGVALQVYVGGEEIVAQTAPGITFGVLQAAAGHGFICPAGKKWKAVVTAQGGTTTTLTSRYLTL